MWIWGFSSENSCFFLLNRINSCFGKLKMCPEYFPNCNFVFLFWNPRTSVSESRECYKWNFWAFSIANSSFSLCDRCDIYLEVQRCVLRVYSIPNLPFFQWNVLIFVWADWKYITGISNRFLFLCDPLIFGRIVSQTNLKHFISEVQWLKEGISQRFFSGFTI